MVEISGMTQEVGMSDRRNEQCGKELSAFQLKRMIRAMARNHSVPIRAYLGDVVISSDCAVGVVVSQAVPSHGHYAGGCTLQTEPIYNLSKTGRFWMVSTKEGHYVLTSFNREMGRASLRALIVTADSNDAPSAS